MKDSIHYFLLFETALRYHIMLLVYEQKGEFESSFFFLYTMLRELIDNQTRESNFPGSIVC